MSDTEPVDWSKQLFDDFVAAGITLSRMSRMLGTNS